MANATSGMNLLAEPANAAEERVMERFRTDTPYFARNCLTIRDKKKRMVALEPNPAQQAFDAKLEEQRLAGKPQRAIVLKARRVGISTWVQAKLIQRSVLTPNNAALVVAHDTETGGKLFEIGERMYRHLPVEIKPEVRSHRRARLLHFGERALDAWQAGGTWPDSTYYVDTANEFQAGRGAEYHDIHASEFAVWGQAAAKHAALIQTVPDESYTLIVIESTAYGHNFFKQLWEDAVAGRSEYVAFFWPWWKQEEYERRFLSVAERADFRVGEDEVWGEDEPGLAELMAEEGCDEEAILRKLNWRRWGIPNLLGGNLDLFRQEYPSTPEEAFLATGARVFDGNLIRKAMIVVERDFDPRIPAKGKGPTLGIMRATGHVRRAGRVGEVEVPIEPEFLPRSKLPLNESPDWRLWLPYSDVDGLKIPEDRTYVVAADVSGGLAESEGQEGDPAYHAIQVIDHQSREQVCEYRSRIDPDLFAEHVYLTALLFNEAWLAVEVTGGWGLPIARKLWHDWRYPYLYFRKHADRHEDSQMDRLGWDTNRITKPVLLAGGQELLREQTHGLRSRRVLSEMTTYIKQSGGKTLPEKGHFADLLMSWLIAQQVALIQPVRPPKKKKDAKRHGYQVRDRITGY